MTDYTNIASYGGETKIRHSSQSHDRVSNDVLENSAYSLDPGRPPVPKAINYAITDSSSQSDARRGKKVQSHVSSRPPSSLSEASGPSRNTTPHGNNPTLDAYSSSALDPTRELSSSEVPVSVEFQKRRDEWAERGAAKLVREYQDPDTGETKKKIVSQGIKDFKFGQEIGDGSYSTVVLATSIQDPSKKYAVKVLNKAYLVRQKKVKYVNIEKQALQRLNNSKCVVKLFFTFQDENSLYFLLEYASNGDFLSLMKKYGSLSEECTQYYSAQIIDAIGFLHKRGIIHRDIKPENILLDTSFKVKLTDFGTAKVLDSLPNGEHDDGLEEPAAGGKKYDLLTRSKSFVGTAEYVSPELLNDSYVDYKCDIWAYGCIVYQMIAGKPPFKATNEYLTFQKVMKVQYAFTAGFPLVVRDLVKKILLKAPEKRLEIIDIKKHYFFKGLNFSKIWDLDPPPVAPYKMSAKSMSPIPALSHGNYSASPKPLLTKTPKKASTPTIHTTKVHAPLVQSSPLSKVAAKKSAVDPKTREILESAKRSVASKKQQQLRESQSKTNLGLGLSSAQNPKNAAVAAVAALSKTSSPSQKPRRKAPSSKQIGAAKEIQHVTPSRSSSSLSSVLNYDYSSDVTKATTDGSHDSRKSNGNTEMLRSPSSSNFSPSHSIISTPDSPQGAVAKSKTQSSWAPYMRSNETVIKMGEIDMVSLPSQVLEKVLHKKSLTLKAIPLNDDQTGYNRYSTGKTSFLSQVAKSGLTGFRDVEEHDLYIEEKMRSNFEPAPEYALHHLDYRILDSDHSSLRKIFSVYSEEEEEELHDKISVVPVEYYERKLALITSQGRCLIFIKSNTSVYHLQYRLYLNQAGMQMKELTSTFNNLKENYHFVLESPFKSFVFQCSIGSSVSWITCLQESMASSKKPSRRPPPLASSTNRVSSNPPSPALASASSFARTDKNSSAMKDISSTKPSNSTVNTALRSPLSHTPSSTTAIKTAKAKKDPSTKQKGERMFDSYVTMKQKKHDSSSKPLKPIQNPIKLVNGLPVLSRPSNSVNADATDLHSYNSEQQHYEDGIRKEIVNAAELAASRRASSGSSEHTSAGLSKLDNMKKKLLSRNK